MDLLPGNAYYLIVPNQDGMSLDVIAHTMIVDVAYVDVRMMIVDEYCMTSIVTPAYIHVDTVVAVEFVAVAVSGPDLFPPHYLTLTSDGDLVVPVVNIVVSIHYLSVAMVNFPFPLHYGHVPILAVYPMDPMVAQVTTHTKKRLA